MEEKLKEDLWKLPGEKGVGFIYFRNLDNVVSSWFKNMQFLKALVALPVRFAAIAADTARPFQYHFVRDFTQPCWCSESGEMLWVGQIVHSRTLDAPVKIVQFQEAAETFATRLQTTHIRVLIEQHEFKYTGELVEECNDALHF
jgi:hypothetical protein